MSVAGLKYYLSSPANMFDFFASRNMLNWMPDEAFLKRKFKLVMGHELDLDSPKTFNEKLQWLKLYDRKPLYTKLVDKFEVRKYIAEKIGEEYLIPLVGGPWNSPDEIDFDALPDRFVLKCTHDSGGVIICKDKSKLDIPAAKAKLNKRLKRNYYWVNREWPYKDVPHRIIAEKYMEDESGELRDFKVFCFNGVPHSVMVCTDRATGDTKYYFFDKNWKMERCNLIGLNAPPDFDIPRPKKLDDIFEVARVLSSGLSFARIDLYTINEKVYFGEITFFSEAGFDLDLLPETDALFGSMLDLNNKDD